jgi:hypothetical protein
VAGLLRRSDASSGGAANSGLLDAVRRTLVETLVHGDRRALVEALDEALLGVRPRPAAALDVQAVAL